MHLMVFIPSRARPLRTPKPPLGQATRRGRTQLTRELFLWRTAWLSSRQSAWSWRCSLRIPSGNLITRPTRVLDECSRPDSSPDGSPRVKARLVTQGFNDPDALSGSVAPTSPTLGRLSGQVLLSMAATLGWTVSTDDISTAFLHSKEHDKSGTVDPIACRSEAHAWT